MDHLSGSIKLESALMWLLYIAAVLLIGRAVGMLVDRWLWKGVSQQLQTERDAAQQINQRLSIEQAKQRCLQALSEPDRFVCEPASNPMDPLLENMPSSLRELASRCEQIQSPEGWIYLNLRALPASAYGEGFYTVGWLDEDRTVEVAMRPHDEKAYVVYWLQQRSKKEPPPVVEYASLYHCLLHFIEGDE